MTTVQRLVAGCRVFPADQPSNRAFESGRADKQRASCLRQCRRAAQRER